MVGEQAATIVALVEEQADGVALAEAHLVADSVLLDLKSLRCRFAKNKLGRSVGHVGLADVTRKNFVIRAT